jgi:uncharacterized repeat protein (TIGR03806 family)
MRRTNRKYRCLTLFALWSACGGEKAREQDMSGAGASVSDASVAEDAAGPDAALPVGPPASAYQDAPDTLDAWHLFANAAKQLPGPRTIPYDVIAPLFSDYAEKKRFLYVPEGAVIGYDARERWQLPEGSILIKTFSYYADVRHPEKGERLLETRLLVFTGGRVVPHTYVWNDAQTQAERKVAGKRLNASWVTADGQTRENGYDVPNTNQCHDCHGKPEVADTLGLVTRQLDRTLDFGDGPENQIDHLAALGLFDVAPEPHAQRERLVDPFGKASLSERARSYLDANCAHCHGQGGDTSTSSMWLGWFDTAPDQDPTRWGVCKRPTSAAGATCEREVDIVPGQPDQSIYMCRLESDEPKVQMPPLGRNLMHAEGVQLLRAWISLLEGSCE